MRGIPKELRVRGDAVVGRPIYVDQHQSTRSELERAILEHAPEFMASSRQHEFDQAAAGMQNALSDEGVVPNQMVVLLKGPECRYDDVVVGTTVVLPPGGGTLFTFSFHNGELMQAYMISEKYILASWHGG